MGCDCKLYDLAQPAMLIDKERNTPIYNALQMSSCREKEVSCKLPLGWPPAMPRRLRQKKEEEIWSECWKKNRKETVRFQIGDFCKVSFRR